LAIQKWFVSRWSRWTKNTGKTVKVKLSVAKIGELPLFGLKGMLIMGAVMATMSSGFYLYYQDTQKKMAVLVQNNARLETAVQTNEETISSLQADYARANAEVNRINNEFQRIREQNRELSNKLARHDLGVLGSEKPELVQRIINGASEKVGRCFELLSGAPLNDKEKAAKNGKEFNSECPWLYDDLVAR
jgi:hypothetical protein